MARLVPATNQSNSPSFRRKPESSAEKAQNQNWTPAFAGVTR
jgi:hypothetical protein